MAHSTNSAARPAIIRLCGVAAALMLLGCQSNPSRPEPATDMKHSPPLKVLMIGNSYTAMTSHIVQAWAASHPDCQVAITLLKRGGMSLGAHLKNAHRNPYDDAPAGLDESLRQTAFDVVTIQEQSNGATTASRQRPETFRRNAGALIEHVRQMQRDHHDGAQPRILLFQTWAKHPDWPRYDDDYTFNTMHEEIRENYGQVANSHDAELIPVGDAFARFYAMEPKPAGIETLHEADHSHPSQFGCALSGLMFCQVLFQRSLEDAATPRHQFLPEINRDQQNALFKLAQWPSDTP